MALDKCPRCGFNDIIQKKVDEVLHGGDDAAVVNVTAEICLHCGERIFAAETFYRFDEIRRKLTTGQVKDFQIVGRYFRVPAGLGDTEAVGKSQGPADQSNSNPNSG